jgi:hypothetical protein
MAPKKVDVKIVGDGLKCVCPEGEGVRVFGDNIQAMWEEQISNIRIKSEQMLLSTKQTQRRIAQMNKTMLDKIKRK